MYTCIHYSYIHELLYMFPISACALVIFLLRCARGCGAGDLRTFECGEGRFSGVRATLHMLWVTGSLDPKP